MKKQWKKRRIWGCFSFILLLAYSCSFNGVNSQYAKILDMTSWQNNGLKTKYSSLKNSNVSLQNAIYGANYNDGNYLFFYGTMANNDVRNLLYGPNGNPEYISNYTVAEQNFASSRFFQTFFVNNNSLGGGGLLPFDVKILLYIDTPPYNEDASPTNGLDGKNSPFDKWSEQDILNQLNFVNGINTQKYTIANIPTAYRFKLNAYKRNDQSAVVYRQLITYLQTIRPNIKSVDNNLANGGLLAFKKNKAPTSFSLNGTNLNNDLINFYRN